MKYIERTDNKYFPNDLETWKEFMWWLHTIGGRAVVYVMHLDAKEKHYREKNKQTSE